MKTPNFTNHFLIAMPNMADSFFGKSLVYVCEHSDKGALGIIVNRPTEVVMGKLFDQLNIPLQNADRYDAQIFMGGPMHTDRGFVLHQPVGAWGSSLIINDDFALTTSKDILQAVANGSGPTRLLVCLGYAGWDAGQLEDEIAENAWLTVKANPDVIFKHAPRERVTAAMGMLGFNPAALHGEAGHA